MAKSKVHRSRARHTPSIAARAVPAKRTLILLESGLLLGLTEGIMWNMITQLHTSIYLKALFLMAGVIGVFALTVRILEPIIQASLKAVAKLDSGGGVLLRLGLHSVILFLIYTGYVRTFFASGK